MRSCVGDHGLDPPGLAGGAVSQGARAARPTSGTPCCFSDWAKRRLRGLPRWYSLVHAATKMILSGVPRHALPLLTAAATGVARPWRRAALDYGGGGEGEEALTACLCSVLCGG